MIQALRGWPVLVLLLAAAACSEDGGSKSPPDAGADTDPPVGDAGAGDFCELNEDCASGFCESFQTSPPDPEAHCADAPPDGEIRILGTVRDFETHELIPEQYVRIAGAMPVLADPVTAPAVAEANTDADGRFDVTAGENATKEMIGLGALIDREGYYLTGTGLVEPEIGGYIYPPGVRNHDIWAVPQSLIDDWSALLVAHDSSLAPYTPLGVNGGTMGMVRDQDTGEGVAGVTLRSRTPDTIAQIFYLNEAGDGLVTDETGSSGHFIVLDAALAEKLDAYRGEALVSVHECTLSQTFGAIFTTSIQVDDDDL